MNGHSFASLALSFLMVGLAAIILRPSEGDLAVVGPPPLESGTEAEKPPDLAREREREPSIAASPLPPTRPRLSAVSAVKVVPKPPPSPPVDEDTGVVHAPGSAFTRVESGETLALVARRVYGSSQARDRLWRGNRDLLPDPEAALKPGTILRTP